MYRIPCHNCDCTYIGETGRNYGKRQKEQRKEVESIGNRTFTRSDRKSRAAEMNQSAITDSERKLCHKLVRCQILERGHRKTRQGKESIWIRKEPNCMNRDGGAYSLPTAYDRLLVTCSTSTSHGHKPDEARRLRAKRCN